MNRGNELKKQKKYHDAWKISKKYTTILMDHSSKDEHFTLAPNTYQQYLSELKHKNIPWDKQKNYIQVWDTMINTLYNNPKVDVCRASLKLLHQTSVQRSN